MEPSKGESSTPPIKLDRRPSPLQSSAAFLHHLHTDPKSHHITLSAGLTRQPSAPPTARSPLPKEQVLEPESLTPTLEPPQHVVRKVSKRSRPRTAPSRPRDEKDEEEKMIEPMDIPEPEDASCVVNFMREDEMTEAMDILSVSGTPRGNSGTFLVGRAGHASPRDELPAPPMSPPAQKIVPSGSPDDEAIGWGAFGKNYAAGNFDPLHVPRPPVPTILEPINSASSSPGLRYHSLEHKLQQRQPTSSDTNSSAGSMATVSTVPSTAPSLAPTGPPLAPSRSAEAVLTVKGMGKPRSMEADTLARRLANKPTGGLSIPSYDIAAATVRMASATSGYGPDSFAPLGAPSPDQELTDPMAGFVSTTSAPKGTGNSDPSHGSRFPLSRSMSSAVDPAHRNLLQLPTIKASPASSPADRPRAKEVKQVEEKDIEGSPHWTNGGSLRPRIPAATAPVEKVIETEDQEDYFGDAVSPPPDISRQTSFAASSGSSQNTVTGQTPAPTPQRRAKTPPPRLDELVDESPPKSSKWSEMGELYNKLGWLPAPLPPNEDARRRALYRFNILHSAPDVNFDRIAHMAKLVFNTKIVLIALIDSDVQWHKTQSGLGADEVNRVSSFCGHSILAKTDEPFVILDTHSDWRFVNSPQVVGPPHVRFYAGAPLRTSDGYNLGSLCVIDDKPRSEFTPRQRLILKEFAAVTIREMELWRDKLQLRVRDKIQNAMEKFTRECLEMDAKSTDKKTDAAAKMDVVYERAAQLVASTLDMDGCFILDLDSFENTQVDDPDGPRTVYRADPYNTENEFMEKAQEFGPIPALPLLASTDSTRSTDPLSSLDHQRLSKFLSENRDGKIYEHKPPSFVKGLFPDELRYAMVIPVFGVDSRPSTLICAHTSKASKQYLEGYELQFLRAIGVIILSAVLRRRMVLADKAKSILISSVSHELRTPLHGILAAAELLADTELDQNQVAFLRTVQSCGNSLIETVNHVLDFTKLSGGSSGSGSSLKLSKVNLSTLIEQTAEGCWVGLRARTSMGDADVGSYYAPDSAPTIARGRAAPGADALPIEIVVDIAHREKGWNVRCEKGGLRRVLTNLIGNSLKFTKDGYIQVTLRELPHAPGSKTIPIEMAVIDTGKGIGKEFLKEQLFHPFSQENPLQTGTGLGLAIVNSIVRSEGVNGKVDVWSAEGMGTEIRVSFEATVIDDEDESSNQSANSSVSSAFGGNHSISFMGFDTTLRGHILSLDVLSSYACSWDFDIKDTNADIKIVHEDEPFARNQILQQKPVVYLSGSRRGEITELANRTMKAGGFLQVLYKPIGPSALRAAMAAAVHWLQTAPALVTPLSPTDLDRPTVSRTSSDASAESNSTVSELSSHKLKHVQTSRLPLYRRRSEETSEQTVTARPPLAPRGLTYHHAPAPTLTRAVSGTTSESSVVSGSPSSSLSTISLADGGVMLKASATPLVTATQGLKPKVLVIEDNIINRRVLGAFLKKNKFEWAEAYNGSEGVDVFRSYPPGHWDVILMDISMPIMNGHEATRAIRQIEADRRLLPAPSSTPTGLPSTSLASTPTSPLQVPSFRHRAKIFALTGLATQDDKREAFTSGVDGYLVKPVSLVTLDAIFKRLGFD